MNKCLYCGKPVKNKYCNISCQNKHQNKNKADKKYGQYKDFKVFCKKCGKEFDVKEREKLFPQKEKYYCSMSCANSREWSEKDKRKKSNSLKKKRIITICENCKKEFEHKLPKKIKYCPVCLSKIDPLKKTICKYCRKEFEHRSSIKRIFCSRSCSIRFSNKHNLEKSRKGGLKSCLVQKENRRSKNETYFSKLCKEHFNNVTTNESIFNGWDADVIIKDLKIAILWNGKWHYKKIKKEHSVKQVQNRDKIKIKEIEKSGYKPYIIKDMGKFNKEFVEEEFKIFLKGI